MERAEDFIPERPVAKKDNIMKHPAQRTFEYRAFGNELFLFCFPGIRRSAFEEKNLLRKMTEMTETSIHVVWGDR